MGKHHLQAEQSWTMEGQAGRPTPAYPAPAHTGPGPGDTAPRSKEEGTWVEGQTKDTGI